MKLELNTLYWNNADPRILEAHEKVMDHFDLDVNYYLENTRHGLWMDHVMKNTTSDVVGFLDGDCVPLSRQAVLDAATYAYRNHTFIGIAQASNHIAPKSHIYAAPAFFFVHREAWQYINTSFAETARGDVAEEFTYRAEQLSIKYRCIYPEYFERESDEGLWPLGNYGYYGVGTTFGQSCYHLYQSRKNTNIELFVDRCYNIIEGSFSNDGMIPSKILNYEGNIVT